MFDHFSLHIIKRKRLNYVFDFHFHNKISTWFLYFYLSQFDLYFEKFDAIKSFLIV